MSTLIDKLNEIGKNKLRYVSDIFGESEEVLTGHEFADALIYMYGNDALELEWNDIHPTYSGKHNVFYMQSGDIWHENACVFEQTE